MIEMSEELALKEEVLVRLHDGSMKLHQISSFLEISIKDAERREQLAVNIRRAHISPSFSGLPSSDFPFHKAEGVCCENMIGFVGIPVGLAGPLRVDGQEHWIPLATTEGALVASTNRGCKALSLCGGVRTVVIGKGMTRGPFIKLPSLQRASEVKLWVDHSFGTIRDVFESTSKHIRLLEVKTALVGRFLFIRFKADTGEAMGMNMVSKASETALKLIIKESCAEDVLMTCLSGNFCTDKKAGAALNWSDGRGYSVHAEARVDAKTLSEVLRVRSSKDLAELAQGKNFVGSAMAGVAAGGQNAHAANLVAALFLACGQDIAQVVESSACMTQCEADPDGTLLISVSMPCIEVGVIGGGTRLPAQASLLGDLTSEFGEGAKAEGFARIVASTVLAGELSLLAALLTGALVSSHMELNRK